MMVIQTYSDGRPRPINAARRHAQTTSRTGFGLFLLLFISVPVLLVLVLVLPRSSLSIFPDVSAFTPPRNIQRQQHSNNYHHGDIHTNSRGWKGREYVVHTSSTTAVTNRMADDNNNYSNDNDDALTKLIGKRNQIKRSSNATASRTELMKEIEEKLSNNNNMESIIDFDLDQLPEFQTPRIQRKSSSSSLDNDNVNKDDDDPKKNAPIIDYMADYNDENDWHIPNRIIISSVAWGDVNQNFVVSSSSAAASSGKRNKNSPTGMKLSQRLQKMGKFVAGDVQVAMQQCFSNGVLALETSASYGSAVRGQKSSAHDLVRDCVMDATNVGLPEPLLIESMSRRDPTTLRNLLFRPATSMVTALETSLGRLGLSQSGAVDMFLVPKYWGVPTSFLTRALVAQIESGQTNHIGVSGVTKASTLRTLQEQIQNLDYTLSANVFPFSLTNQKYDYMIQVCQDLGIVPLIRDPLDGGLASGVYTAMNPSGGMVTSTKNSNNAKFSFAQLEKLQPLHSVQETLCDRVRTRVIRNMRTIQDKYSSLSRYSDSPMRDINTDITTTQIALQYIIAKGGVPMVPVNNPIQAKDVLGCLGWTLTDDEVAMLDSAIALCKL